MINKHLAIYSDKKLKHLLSVTIVDYTRFSTKTLIIGVSYSAKSGVVLSVDAIEAISSKLEKQNFVWQCLSIFQFVTMIV